MASSAAAQLACGWNSSGQLIGALKLPLVLPPATARLARAGKLKVLPAMDITPTMTCPVRMIQISAILRVSLAPVLPDLPFVGAVSLSLMTPPYLDFDLRCRPWPRPAGLHGCIWAVRFYRHNEAVVPCP